MLDTFPRLILKENRKALSMREAMMWIKIAKAQSKLALYGLYAFETWKDGVPDLDSVVLEVIALKGKKETLMKLGEKFLKEKKQSLLLFDGEIYLLIVEHDGTPLERIKEPPGTELIRDLMFKFTYPNTPNGKTGVNARIIKRFKID